MSSPATEYRWVSAYHWFEEQFLELNGIEGEVRAAISSLVRNADPEYIEQYFGAQMSEDGYYDEYLVERCPECGDKIKLDDAMQCPECLDWFHDVHECINTDESACWSCIEIEEALHQ